MDDRAHHCWIPGAPSIVPGGAEMLFQFRDTDPALLAKLEGELEALVAEATRGPCRVTIAERGRSVPQAMDAGFQDALERAAERHAPGLHVRMPSGAGHDAQILAERMKSAMLFVPSIGGISHHYAENTKDEDIVLGCQVLADARRRNCYSVADAQDGARWRTTSKWRWTRPALPW